MKKTLIALVAMLALALSAGGRSADLTISAPSCASWSLSGSTLTCSTTAGVPTPTPAPNPTPTPTPVPSGSIGCAGYAATQVVDAPWPPNGVTNRSFSSGFTSGALVVRFTTGSKPGFGRITLAEWATAPTIRTATISTRPCDWSPQASIYATAVGVTAGINFSVGPNTFGYPALAANTVYYVNVVNAVNGMPTCSDSCDVFIDLKSPF